MRSGKCHYCHSREVDALMELCFLLSKGKGTNSNYAVDKTNYSGELLTKTMEDAHKVVRR